MVRRGSYPRETSGPRAASLAHQNGGSGRGNAPKNAAGGGRKSGGKKGPRAEPTPEQITQNVAVSRLPVVIALEVPGASEARVPLVECGLNAWQELVELERVVESLRRPTKKSIDGNEDEEDVLEGVACVSKNGLELNARSVDAVHKFATTLQLRLQSLSLPVRSIVGEKLVILGVDGSSQVNWSAITVRAEDELLQQVVLPPVRQCADPISQLRNPRLLPMVDAIIQDNSTSGRIQVVILRGIPGSGKSTLGRDIVAICESRGLSPVVCSGDTYFETSRGYHFDVKSLSKAHEAAKKKFQDALFDAQAPIIIVDNTHTQRWEYEVYEQRALEWDCSVHFLEMQCADILTCVRMAQRNSHGVSAVKVLAMYMRWEPDARATIFKPQFAEPFILTNPVTRNPLNNYVAYVGLFLDDASREKLLRRIPARHVNVIAEHITLFYRPKTQFIRQIPIGRRYKVRVIEAVSDSHGQALRVELDEKLHVRGRNKVPHITVSTADGVSAFYSNELFENPNANKDDIGDLELEATLGVALMGQNRKIISEESPFADQFLLNGATDDLGCDTFTPPEVLLVVEIPDFSEGAGVVDYQSLMRSELLKFCSTPVLKTRVIAWMNRAVMDNSVEKALASLNLVAPGFNVDTTVMTTHADLLATLVQETDVMSDSIKRIVVLSSSVDRVGYQEMLNLGCHVSIKTILTTHQLQRLALALDASLTRALDEMGVSPTEEASYTSHIAVNTVERALAKCGVAHLEVKRVDSSVWSHPAAVFDVVIDSDGLPCSAETLRDAFQVEGTEALFAIYSQSDSKATIYFQPRTTRTRSPLVRINAASNAVNAVRDLQKLIRDELCDEDSEAFPRVVSVIANILQGQLAGETWPAAVQLLTEQTVLKFFKHQPYDPSLRGEETQTFIDHRVLWSRILNCLRWLSSWGRHEWSATLEDMSRSLTPLILLSPAHVEHLARSVPAILHAACLAGETATTEASTTSPHWGKLVLSLLHCKKPPAVTPLTRRQHHIKHESPCTSALRTLRYCDRALQVSQNPTVNPDGSMLFCSPFPVIPGIVTFVATSDDLIDRVIEELDRQVE